ncbi:MAG: hypothetical protein K8F59_00005 [Rhodobacteraceae bacterium]|nr:hypothetical protein [Paracoccaceae bacterium]
MIINHDFTPPGRSGQADLPHGIRTGGTLLVGFGNLRDIPMLEQAAPGAVHLSGARLIAMPRAVFGEIAPQLVLSPLVSGLYDVIDIATALAGLGYRGCYRALVHRLPRRDVILAEVRHACPTIRFDIAELATIRHAAHR